MIALLVLTRLLFNYPLIKELFTFRFGVTDIAHYHTCNNNQVSYTNFCFMNVNNLLFPLGSVLQETN